jgi:hypothetical protein
MLEVERKLRNQSLLMEMYPVFRVKVAAVLQEMESYGYRPRIQEAWRSVATQISYYRQGLTKLQYSFHTVTGENGEKEALAADIIDDDRPDGVKLPYILHLAAAAKNNGLITGAYFDLAPDKIANLDAALAAKNWSAPVHIGWDPLHIQITGMTPDEAKEGKRPGDGTTSPSSDSTSGTTGTGTGSTSGSTSGTTGTGSTGGSTSGTSGTSSTTPSPTGTGATGGTMPTSTQSRRFRILDLDTNQSTDLEQATALRPVTLLPVPYVSQLGIGADAHRNDCGAAAVIMLLRAYLGTVMMPDEFYARFNIPGDAYLSIPQMRNAMGSLGLLTDMRASMALQDIFNTISTGKPLIVLFRYRILSAAGLTERAFEGPHFAVAVGMDCKYIYLHDPLYTNPVVGEAHPYPLDLFWQAWKEVANDPANPNPERAAIIPVSAIGFRLTRKAKITAQSLYVRSKPSVDGAVVGTLKQNDLVEIRREISGWGEIGDNRWISLAYTATVQ